MNLLETPRTTAIVIVLALLATCAAYWAGLQGPFLLDDAANLGKVADWVSGRAELADVLNSGKGVFGRPLSMASFALSAGIGGYTPFAFKLGNLLIHLLCGIVAHALVLRIARRDVRLEAHARIVALVVAGAWLLHPLNASTVLYAVQRMAQLSTLFVLLGMLLYVVARARLEQGPSAFASAALFLGIPTLTVAGFLSKENGVLLPLLCLVLELGCFRASPPNRSVKSVFAIFLLLPLLAGLALFAMKPARLLGGYANREFDWQERLLTQARALCEYLSQILLPNPTRMGVYTDDFAVSTGLLAPPSTLFALLALLAITTLAWRLRKHMGFLFVGWGMFLAAHALESSIIPLEMYFEHRNYLPMIGVLYAVAGLLVVATERLPGMGIRPARSVIPAGMMAFALLALTTHGRAVAWSSERTLVEAAVASRPDSMRAQLAVVSEALARRDHPGAQHALDALTRSDRPRVRAQGFLNRINLDCALRHEGDPRDLQAALAAVPARITKDESETFDLLFANTRIPCRGISNVDLATAAARFAQAASEQPDSLAAKAELRHVAARFHARDGAWADALPQARLAWQPNMPAAAAAILVQSQLATGDTDGAEKSYREASRRAKPDDASGLRWLRAMIDNSQAEH